ncbi:MAG: ThuA domain-containing protein [Terriglobia bacterium]|jgi:type 1 glutamine amidotransferase
MSRILSAFLLLFACLTALPAQTPPKIKVLILTGVSNHAWRATTPVIREILEGTGKFDVRVNEEVRGNTLQTFSSYDVLLLNYNDMKNSGLWWDEGARQALLDFVRNGNGLVSYHASNNAFWGWQEFDKLVGGTWRETAGHAPYHAYTVSIVDRDHPITKGMPASFAETDELYHRLSLEPNIHILAAAFDDPNNCHKPGEGCGTGKDEPLIWTLPYGAGRVFQTALGHDVKAMQSSGFILTLQRGTEWAATGQVTIPVPADMK